MRIFVALQTQKYGVNLVDPCGFNMVPALSSGLPETDHGLMLEAKPGNCCGANATQVSQVT